MFYNTSPCGIALPTFMSASILLLSTLSAAQKDNGDECSCFKTNGSSSAYFNYHRFHDFRNVNVSLTSNPDIFLDPTNTSNADTTSTFFTDQAWTNDWNIQTWNNSDSMSDDNATVVMINSANNIYIENSTDSSSSYSTYLTLRTTRTPDFQSASEFDSTEQNMHYLSARFLARVVGSPGSCAGMFTYLASSPVQEADIEILTAGPRDVVQYTNQPSNSASGDILSNATVNATMPFGLDWSSWNAYRLDWTPERSAWYVNGDSVANISFQAPYDPAGLIVNMWSDGGPWTGNMSVHDAAFLQIQYIEIAYNTSGPYAGSSLSTGAAIVAEQTSTMTPNRAFGRRDGTPTPGCKVVCSIDEAVNASSVGTPAVLYNNTGTAAFSSRRPGKCWAAWLLGIFVSSLVWLAL